MVDDFVVGSDGIMDVEADMTSCDGSIGEAIFLLELTPFFLTSTILAPVNISEKDRGLGVA